jgi:uncharacterized protein (TIGR03032 family)
VAFAGGVAFVGLSKIRESATFGGLPIAARWAELKCGVSIVELSSGQIVGQREFDRGVEEFFNVQLLSGVRFPAVIGVPKDAIQGAFRFLEPSDLGA